MYSSILHVHVHVHTHTHTHTHTHHTHSHVHSYFEGSDSESGGEGGGIEGESEEAVRRRMAAEYQNEGLWSTTSSGKDNKQGEGRPRGMMMMMTP